MTKWNLVFWEPVVSPHKADLVRRLACSDSVESVVYIADADLPATRASQGWHRGDFTGVELVVSPSDDEILDFVKRSGSDSIHIFSGTRHVRCIVKGLAAVLRFKRKFGILSEPRQSEGLFGILRRIQSIVTEEVLRRRASFVLAIGRNGPSWYRSVGYRNEKIFPFAYFVDCKDLGLTSRSNISRRATPIIAFMGRFEREKGIELFLGAIERIGRDARIKLAGSGSFESEVKKRCVGRAEYVGKLPMSEVGRFLSEVDILVVPSISDNDGWAVVVSEALMAGCAVVATKKVGASICLKDYRGLLVEEMTARGLGACIDRALASDILSIENARLRSIWGKTFLSGDAGARYLQCVLEHVFKGGERPAPFYEVSYSRNDT